MQAPEAVRPRVCGRAWGRPGTGLVSTAAAWRRPREPRQSPRGLVFSFRLSGRADRTARLFDRSIKPTIAREASDMSKVEIIGIPQSTYVRVIRMACEEKGIDYALSPAPPHSPDVDAIHPFGKVPVMRHGNIALCESKAIATYLDRVFEGPKLIPDDPETAALVEQWVSLVNTVMDQTLVRTYLFAYIFPKGGDGKPDRAMLETVVPP